MAYTNLTALSAKMPLVHISEALSNDGVELEEEGLQEALDAVIETVDNEIDAALGGRFTVPFSDPPALVKHASLILTLESLHANRIADEDKNAWAKKADALRKQLKEIGLGKQPLTPGLDGTSATRPSGHDITADNLSVASNGRLPC